MELFTKLFGSLLVFVYHCFDRIVIHGYLSALTRPEQVVYFFRQVVGVEAVDKEILSRRTGEYQDWVEAFARNHDTPIEWAEKGVRKEDYVQRWRRSMVRARRYGVYFIFKSMEQGPTFRCTVPKYPTRDPHHRILAPQRSRFTHYYFYIRDETLGPIAMRVASFFPFQTTYYLNGHSFIDGAPGLIAAVEQVFPASLRQRCLAHKMRNLEAKVPAERWREFGPMARAVHQASSPVLARLARDEFVKTWGPRAAQRYSVLRGRLRRMHRAPAPSHRAPSCDPHNEPSGARVRRGAPPHKGDPARLRRKAVMKLMYAALMRARQGWRNVIVTSFEVKQIETLRDYLRNEFDQRHASPLKSASRSRIHSTHGT